MVIWKYTLPRTQRSVIAMPEGAQILHCENQNDEPFIWAMVDPDRSLENRNFLFVGTGQDFYETNLHHITTFLMSGGSYVWHVFEIIE